MLSQADLRINYKHKAICEVMQTQTRAVTTQLEKRNTKSVYLLHDLEDKLHERNYWQINYLKCTINKIYLKKIIQVYAEDDSKICAHKGSSKEL